MHQAVAILEMVNHGKCPKIERIALEEQGEKRKSDFLIGWIRCVDPCRDQLLHAPCLLYTSPSPRDS